MAATIPNPKLIAAQAAKRFFIDMLVKDIELIPAIADLVDNSVDGARSRRTGQNLRGQTIEITADADGFSISDNSGGISVETARKYAFRFGRPAEFKGTAGSVGQFGIGMKRALFKLGSEFTVRSQSTLGERLIDYFSMSVNVDEWAKNENDWTFEFDELQEAGTQAKLASNGTSITVSPLHGSVSDDLGDRAVVDELRLQLRTRHERSINAGLQIVVNGERLRANAPELQSSDEFGPVNRHFEVTTDQGVVVVDLYAGTVATASELDDEDDGVAQNFASASPAGWYVYCNDRLLLAADKAATTGWGSVGAVYHPQYRQFRGYVYMSAENAAALPWNTTKTAVDRDSLVYRRVLSEMKEALAEVQSVLNKVKAERSREDADEYPTPLVRALAAAPNVPLSLLARSDAISAPPATPRPRRTKSDPQIQRIQYVVDKKRYDQLAEAFGSSSGSELGRQTFDYAFAAEVD